MPVVAVIPAPPRFQRLRSARELRIGKPLTRLEWECLRAFARTGDAAQAGGELSITLQTCKNHLSHAYAKLDVLGGINAFRKLGWLRVPPEEHVTFERDRAVSLIHARAARDAADRYIAELDVVTA